MQSTQTLVDNFTRVIINPIIALIFAVGLLLFAWGIIEFLWGSSSGDQEKMSNGKRHMLWGVIGMFIMATAFTIIKLLDASVGSNLIN